MAGCTMKLDPDAIHAVSLAIKDTLEHELSCKSEWMGNRRVFRFCQYLAAVISQTKPSRLLRPYLQMWYDACQEHMKDDTDFDGSEINLTFTKACGQFANIWDGQKVDHPTGYHWAQFYDEPEPDIAADYDDPNIRRLVSCLYHAAKEDENWHFFITQADAGRIMGCKQHYGKDAMALLCSDGVIRLLQKGHTGKASTYEFLAQKRGFVQKCVNIQQYAR